MGLIPKIKKQNLSTSCTESEVDTYLLNEDWVTGNIIYVFLCTRTNSVCCPMWIFCWIHIYYMTDSSCPPPSPLVSCMSSFLFLHFSTESMWKCYSSILAPEHDILHYFPYLWVTGAIVFCTYSLMSKVLSRPQLYNQTTHVSNFHHLLALSP